ncbi:MAG: tryptophan-rich sensory protein, partial [Candidatus Hodarchaeota archaeon]
VFAHMTTKINPKIYQGVNIIAVVVTIIFNFLANALPLNRVTTEQVSDSYPNLFTPPGYVFVIWGVIYTLALLFMVYQARANQREEAYLREISFLYFIGALINISWLFLFHYSYGVSTIFGVSVIDLVLLLVVLLLIYGRLGIGTKEVSRNQKLAVHLPISVYLGWISLATIAAIASELNVLIPDIPMATQELWTAIMIIVALVLTLLMVDRRSDFAFGLVVIWASIGIAEKQSAIPLIFMTAISAAILIAVALIIMPFLKKTSIVNFYMVRGGQ